MIVSSQSLNRGEKAMGASLIGSASLQDAIKRRRAIKILNRRYPATDLECFITPRWNTRRRMKVRCIDFNRDGSGLLLPVPAYEENDEICFFARVKTDHELKLRAMPAVVCYRIQLNGEFRIGLNFMPTRSMFQEDNARRQAEAIESFLANASGHTSPAMSNSDSQIKYLAPESN